MDYLAALTQQKFPECQYLRSIEFDVSEYHW